MRTFIIVTACAVVALSGGCTDILNSGGARLTDIINNEVGIEKRKNTPDSNVYLVTYKVDGRVDRTWAASQDVMAWLKETEFFSDITPLPGAGSGSAGDRDGERYYVELPGSRGGYVISVVVDDSKRMIDIVSDAPSQNADEVTYLNIKMQPFLEGSTLVTAELRVTGGFLSALKSLGRIPEWLLTGRAIDKWLDNFAEQLAEVHREKARTPLPPAPDYARVHVIAVGVNSLADPGAMAHCNLKPLAYAEDDASAFYEWATTRFPLPDGDDSVLRQRLIGSEATAHNVQKVLNELKEVCLSGIVREEDTVLFFFAGQIRPLQNEQVNRSKVMHLLTYDTIPEQASLTAIPRSDVLDALRLSRASRSFLFIDSCFGGGFRVRATADLEPPARYGPPEDYQELIGARTALFAAEFENTSCAEDDEGKHGLFTAALLQGLRIPYVTANELSTYVSERVRNQTDSWQLPLFYVSDGYPVDAPIFGDAPAP